MGTDSKKLAGKVAVVTGPSKGIGAAIAKALGAADAAVVANYSSSRKLAHGAVAAAINPGIVETEGTHSTGITESDFRKQAEVSTPLGRIGQPQDIASVVLFLASADSSWITGENLHLSGGLR